MLQYKRIKEEDKFKEIYGINKESCVLFAIKDNDEVGYVVIKSDVDDRIEIIVKDEFQNKGYGSELFRKALSIIKDDIKVQVNLDDYKMMRIIEKNKGIELTRTGMKVIYFIPNSYK